VSDLEELRDAYIEHTLGHKPCTSLDDWAGERFDAILAQHDREVAAEALEEAADRYIPHRFGRPGGVLTPDTWLRDRATRLRENGGA